MARKLKPLVIPLWCLLIGAFLLFLGFLTYGSRSEALDRLHNWTKTSATVTQSQPSADEGVYRYTVKYNSSDGERREGWVFDRQAHATGDVLTIFYDPNVAYRSGGEVFTEAKLAAEAGSEQIWEAAGWTFGGLVAFAFGVYRIRRVTGAIGIASFFQSSYQRLTRPTQLVTPSLSDRIVLEKTPGHDGQSRKTAVEFLIPPPREVGTVISAESSVPAGGGPKPLPQRLAVGFIFAGLVVLGFYGATRLGDDHSDDQGLMIGGWGLAAAIFIAHCFAIRYKADCSFIGECGLARCTIKGNLDATPPHGRGDKRMPHPGCTIKGNLDATPQAEMMLFDSGSALHANQTDIYVYGFYKCTEFDFTWTNRDGDIVWRIQGSYRTRARIKEGHPWRFAQGAEVAWSAYSFSCATDQLAREGLMEFRIGDRRSVRIRPGIVEFHFGGEPVLMTRQDIASFTLASGRFTFKSTDAKWYSLARKYSFPYGEMANARMFLIALERYLGYRLT